MIAGVLTDPALWARLQGHEFRVGGQTLVQRVHQQRSLSVNAAELAVAEYRRFLYLAALHDRAVAAPAVIAAVWQEHLSDTQSYGELLCGGVIGRAIHHHPDLRHDVTDADYLALRGRYAAEFGVAPPPRFWPDAAVRRLMRANVLALVVAGIGLFYGITGAGAVWVAICLPVVVMALIVVFWREPLQGRRRDDTVGG